MALSLVDALYPVEAVLRLARRVVQPLYSGETATSTEGSKPFFSRAPQRPDRSPVKRQARTVRPKEETSGVCVKRRQDNECSLRARGRKGS